MNSAEQLTPFDFPQTRIDQLTLRTSETDKLLDDIPVLTLTGRAYIDRCVTYDANSAAYISAQQGAVAELADNERLTSQLKELLGAIGNQQSETEDFFAGAVVSSGYKAAKAWNNAIGETADSLEREVMPESALYLQILKDGFCSYRDTRLSAMLKGPLYHTISGLKTRSEKSRLLPGMRFRNGLSGRILAPGLTVFSLAEAGILPRADEFVIMPLIVGGALELAMVAAGANLKDFPWNNPLVYRKIRQQSKVDAYELNEILSLIGPLDTLRALATMKATLEANGHQTIFPVLDDSEDYHFEATDLKNPLLALKVGSAVVANNIELGDESKLTFLTGPNSGGKSTISKSVVQSQVLAQLGSPLVASSARIAIADKISYHTPTPPDLEGETGRFEYELKRLRKILDESSSRSLVVLDDCLDGTTQQERAGILKNVLEGFRHLSGAVLFSTHAHEVADQYIGEAGVSFLQVEFSNERPTYRIKKGISRSSHADRVAVKHGFSEELIREEIARRTKQLDLESELMVWRD